ncbi:hypothetical protein D3C76_1323640 [compost metagenome]
MMMIAGLQRGHHRDAAQQRGIAADGLARSGFQRTDQQENQQQRTDQAQAEHQRNRDIGVGQDDRANHTQDHATQPRDAVIGQRCLEDQQGHANGNQPEPQGIGAWQHEAIGAERRPADRQQRNRQPVNVHRTLRNVYSSGRYSKSSRVVG